MICPKHVHVCATDFDHLKIQPQLFTICAVLGVEDWRLPSLYHWDAPAISAHPHECPNCRRNLPPSAPFWVGRRLLFFRVSRRFIGTGVGFWAGPQLRVPIPLRARRIADVLPLDDARLSQHREARSVLGSWAQGHRDDQNRA